MDSKTAYVTQCSYVCPHAVIRPFLLDEEELAKAPEGYPTLKAMGKGMENLKFKIQISIEDCTGCGNCINVCPAKQKALAFKPYDTQLKEIPNWYFSLSVKPKQFFPSVETVKGSQFKQPLLEFSGACAGCGETPYAKLITQLYGDRMIIANATGCSSIWQACAFYAIPLTKRVKVLHGLTPCLKIMPSLAMACILLTSK